MTDTSIYNSYLHSFSEYGTRVENRGMHHPRTTNERPTDDERRTTTDQTDDWNGTGAKTEPESGYTKERKTDQHRIRTDPGTTSMIADPKEERNAKSAPDTDKRPQREKTEEE